MSTKKQPHRIFVTVWRGVAEVDWDTVPEGVEVEVIDLDELDPDRLSAEGRAYAKREGHL